MANHSQPFWQQKTLAEMSAAEWESLCDGCGKCCLHKLEDEDTGEMVFTAVACRMLDTDTCRCRDYANRHQHVPDCLTLTPDATAELQWLPATCAYRLLSEHKPLPDWHPLISGTADSVHRAQVSMRQRCINEDQVNEEDWDLYVIDYL